MNNVALLSARACLFREKEGSSSDGEKDEKTTTEYKAIDPNLENDFCESETAVAAQLEVLYDVTQEFVIKNSGLDSLFLVLKRLFRTMCSTFTVHVILP